MTSLRLILLFALVAGLLGANGLFVNDDVNHWLVLSLFGTLLLFGLLSAWPTVAGWLFQPPARRERRDGE